MHCHNAHIAHVPLTVTFQTLGQKMPCSGEESERCLLCNVCSRSVFLFGREIIVCRKCISGPRKYLIFFFNVLRLLGFVFVVIHPSATSPLRILLFSIYGFPSRRVESLLPHVLRSKGSCCSFFGVVIDKCSLNKYQGISE